MSCDLIVRAVPESLLNTIPFGIGEFIRYILGLICDTAYHNYEGLRKSWQAEKYHKADPDCHVICESFCSERYEHGWAGGKLQGYIEGQAEGSTEGLTQGNHTGFLSGYMAGAKEGNATGFAMGRQIGFGEGYLNAIRDFTGATIIICLLVFSLCQLHRRCHNNYLPARFQPMPAPQEVKPIKSTEQ